ncbi:ATP-binding protein [Streptomyces sp. NPDC020597]|uniref:ATP-binding protein n=1 Tax=unclassified Streptomyces TaxID=2593676 RepID=UPI0037A68CF4
MDGACRAPARLFVVEGLVRAAVDRRRGADARPDDPLLGLYLSEEHVGRLLERPDGIGSGPREGPPLAAVERGTEERAEAGSVAPVQSLARRFGLSPFDVDVLLIALLPDLDAAYEQLYGYLNDDVTRRRACIGLALEVLGADARHPGVRARFFAGGPLVAGGLLEVEDPGRPFLTRGLRVPDRVAAYLLGDGAPDPRTDAVLRVLPPADAGAPAGPEAAGTPVASLTAALRAGVRLVHLHQAQGGSATGVAATALRRAGLAALALDLTALASTPDPEQSVPVVVREARLRGGGLVVGPLEALEPVAHPEHRRLLRTLAGLPVPVVFTGHRAWDPQWSGTSPLTLAVPGLDADERAALWREALTPAGGMADGMAGGKGVEAGDGVDADGDQDVEVDVDDAGLADLVSAYVLTPEQIRRAAETALGLAASAGGGVTRTQLSTAVRGQNATGLDRLARRVEPAVGWADLVVPEPVSEQLGELARRARHRERVLGQWGMRPGGGRGRGVLALLAGESGTGKTMSAEVIAGDLGLDLYVVDLSSVVDKYIGETEKNLERIFTEASGVNGILLFDEADAVFSKRSEVKDSHDRNANMESAYLLQRMESFDGIAVLTTNLRSNLDEAFIRRLDVIVDFPMPEPSLRRDLWDRCLGPSVPRADGLDLDFCARFELAGGSIRACVITAAYRAAESGQPVSTADLVGAIRQEYRKLGRLVLDHEFAPRRATTR